ncbi:hypothetical protein F4805DRAFT_285703 [Annulohypoxylon moriforme]|nr:hypothetical protein F4805DRAFT_285703 [Annulohypoxylon moriforme]
MSLSRYGVYPMSESSKMLQREDRREDRRRAVEALRQRPSCVLCRKKRRKCDNKTPACGHCLRNEQECLYPDTLLGIARLGLDRRRRGRQAHTASSDEKFLLDEDVLDPVVVGMMAAKNSCCESILSWGFVSELTVGGSIKSLPLLATAKQISASAPPRCHHSPKQESGRISKLCDDFLRFIHIKHPIIEVQELRQYAREADEHGPAWDGPGCLVLLACALSRLVFFPSFSKGDAQSLIRGISSNYPATRTFDDEGIEAEADGFFNEAQRRLGSLSDSLIAVQCTYLEGLYKQLSLKPLDAWHSFRHACVRFQTLQHIEKLLPRSADNEEQEESRVRQCLYWLCVKAEYELRAEFGVELKIPVPSGLNLCPFKRPEPACTTDEEFDDSKSILYHAPDFYQYPDSSSWCSIVYHEAEISLSGIMTHALNDIYGKGEANWLYELTNIMRKCAAYREELETWHENLHPLLIFPPPISNASTFPEFADHMLSFTLQIDYLSVIELLHRPFIFVVLFREDIFELTADRSSLFVSPG